MDSTQERHERSVGDVFIDWYNAQCGSNFRYAQRGADPPDLVYRVGKEELLLEIAGAYYDASNATMLWEQARGVPDAADTWQTKSPDQKLIDSINAVLAKKAEKRYPPNCALVVNVYPDVTSAEELEHMIGQVIVPPDNPFKGVYLSGSFPMSSGGGTGGYRCWKLA